MKLVHKLIIAAIGLSLLPTMCAKNSEPTESVQQPQPIATVAALPPVTNFCHSDAEMLTFDRLSSDYCQNSRNRIKADSYKATVTDQEIKVGWCFAKEPNRCKLLLLNRVTNDYTIFTIVDGNQEEYSGISAINENKADDGSLTVTADLYAEGSFLTSFGFTINQ